MAPFNYPINLLISKIIPALLTGNVVIYKSANQTYIIGYIVAKLFNEIKIPHGVVNYIVTDGKDLGATITANESIKLLNFTGGTKTGKEIMRTLASSTNRILEMGGLDPALITKNNDDPITIANEIVKGAFSFNGQRCTAIKRIILLKDNQEFNQKLKIELINAINKLTVGKAVDDANITALVNDIAVKRVLDLYDDAIKNNAKALILPKIDGNIVTPILLDDVTKKMKIYDTEAFGPILPIIYAKDIDDMIHIANDTQYGLQASVFTKNEEE
ncbi:aldehyde dehydrogenase family protein [bacterium]|nr:aldehyde dehydrogenase family protein [bacterium]